jgi:hypothetical protein
MQFKKFFFIVFISLSLSALSETNRKYFERLKNRIEKIELKAEEIQNPRERAEALHIVFHLKLQADSVEKVKTRLSLSEFNNKDLSAFFVGILSELQTLEYHLK